ncbi:secondary thiamine-phosphate synthase enzyme YjbQ [Methanobacterium petrolearium]|uniref:secondary thiamine-phosphate synthase enzyme YjbQ n=1 Tax=Methanobacterium petrolearium TaxID=710190 RepID=UPI001AE894DD|nr:secondary thiamine-phosphate synthase enzyme YjbQ [Methanobacterium petrolearium]MBP1945420.1 secondary thiamine-phosphate synthase enzyme [Methanobacterium petrolearium]
MKNAREIIEIRTSQRVEILDITREVEGILSQFGVKEGLLNVYSRHSTSGVVINENESGLISDFQMALEKIIPQGAGYHHDRIDNNADSHIRGFLIGGSQTVPVENGTIMLGTWQSIFFVELDGPRQRKLTVTVMGE